MDINWTVVTIAGAFSGTTVNLIAEEII